MHAKQSTFRTWGGAIFGLVLLAVFAGCAATTPSADKTSDAPLAPVIPSTAKSAPGEPIFRLDTGGHTAVVRRIGVDAKERYLVTGSDDKLVRVWSLTDGALLQTLRIPVDRGDEGKIFAVALSADGQTVAAGGWTGWAWDDEGSIYLFDRAGGRMIRRLGGLPNVITHLTFSRDGRFLAVSLGGANGIRVYRTHDWTEIAADRDYGGDSYSCHFAFDGRLVTTSLDGFVRLYNAHFELIAKAKAPGPSFAHFSPDGNRVAVGFNDTTAVNVLSGDDLGFLYAPDTAGVDNGNLTTVEWSRDGQRLYGAGSYDDGSGRNPVRIWENGGKGSYRDVPIADSTVLDLAALSDGGLAFGTFDPAFGVLSASGAERWVRRPEIVDFRGNDEGFQTSFDGGTIRFAYRPWGEAPAVFSLAERRIIEGVEDTLLHPPRTEAPGLDIQGWEDTTNPTLNGASLPLDEYETSRSVAIAPDGEHFLLGTEWSLRYFDQEGQQQWRVPVPGVAWSVNIAGSGRVGIAAFGDGTIRWYNLADGKELLAFFPHRDAKRWVLWNPAGFFDASPGGDALIGYHLNQGRDRAAEFVQVAQLTKLFFRPELVTAYLDDKPSAVQDALAQIGDIQTILAQLPPEVEILGPAEVTIEGNVHKILVRVIDKGGGIGAIGLRLNDTAMTPRKPPLKRKPGTLTAPIEFPSGSGDDIGELFEIEVPVASGRKAQIHDVQVEAENAAGTVAAVSPPQRVTVKAQAVPQPLLHVLAVGINQYRDSDLRLKYAVNDAREITDTLVSRRWLYGRGKVLVLENEDATLSGIEQAFERMIDAVQPNDVFVLFLSGHGRTFQGSYHFLPREFIYESDNVLGERSVSEERLAGWLSRIQANKTLLILDTCEAGSALRLNTLAALSKGTSRKASIARLMRLTGRAIIAASSEQSIALEGFEEHGVFSYAVLEGLNGAADKDDGGTTVNELSQFVVQRMPELTLQKWNIELFPMQDLHGHAFVIGE